MTDVMDEAEKSALDEAKAENERLKEQLSQLESKILVVMGARDQALKEIETLLGK